MRNIKGYTATAPSYIGEGRNVKGAVLAETINEMVSSTFGEDATHAHYMEILKALPFQEIEKYGVVIVGSPD